MRTLLSLIFCGLIASALHAEGLSLTACPPGQPLQFYEDQFPSIATPCANGILNFSNFNFQLYQSSGPGTPLMASQIDLTPTPIGSGQTGVTGFSVTGLDGSSITVAPGEDATYVLDWLFVIDAGPHAGGASLGMDPPFGDVTITQYYCLDSNFQNGQTYNGSAPSCTTSLEGTTPDVQTLSVTTDIPNDLTDSIIFNPPAEDYANVMTVIQLSGGDNGSGFDSASGTSLIDPPASVPEPGSLLLIPGALLVLGFPSKTCHNAVSLNT